MIEDKQTEDECIQEIINIKHLIIKKWATLIQNLLWYFLYASILYLYIITFS
jgi:hypothetical protein